MRQAWQQLPNTFFQQQNVLLVARGLIGKILITQFNGLLTAGRIVETEAYNGIIDKASHSYNGRRTNRTEVMYAAGGVSYVYLCYGIHHLFNIVTGIKDTPHAVLIRAVEPLVGIDIMLARVNKNKADATLTKGPGNVSKALGISTLHSGSEMGNEIFVADDGFAHRESDIIATPRIGVDYAGEDALLPYRFIVRGNKYVSGKKA
ncbi:DNA-3-methyladenine glycosylase [Parasediminibacterium sp. JCM 36343]|uniref:DNA-3-methyladenine glycosylase n=1 Tax=Parasediminibacterium sp. JCM 36343 TaxID=3374279 RepID=UPI00397D3D8F